MKKSPFGKTAAPQRASFGKSKPAFGDKPHGKKPEGRRSEAGSFDKKPRRFDRSDEGGERTERFAKAPSRFSKKPAFDKRDEPRKSSGDFDKKPRRFDRSDEGGERTERFAKAPSRFSKKPAFGKRDEPRKPSGDFEKRPRRFDHRDESDERPARTERFSKRTESYGSKPAFGKKPERKPERANDKSKFRPKRESLQRQGVLLWGLHAVREAWLNPARTCYRLWATENGMDALEATILDGNEKGLARPDASVVEKSEIEHFLPHNTVHQGVVLEVAPLAEMTLDDLLGQDECPQVIVILDQVTDPHNVGAILRSAAAFGAGAVIVTERNAPNATGVLAKTACGALEHVPLISVVNMARTIEVLQEESFWCVGLAEEGDHDLSTSKLASGRIALVMGAEGEGLRRLTREHCDELARLPTQGPIGSLNVSNAAATALYEAVRQRKSAE